MAKNFPYFKFIATEWLTGDIVFESLEVQGLFINICAIYWQRDGVLTVDDINKRYNNSDGLAKLSGRYLWLNDGNISIKFLDEQLEKANHISIQNSLNGKKGAELKALKTKGSKAGANDGLAKLSKEKKRKEEEKNNINIPPLQEFLDYSKEKMSNDFEALKKSLELKYASWVENGWKTGIDKPIKNWKSTLLNTIQYLPKDQSKQSTNKPFVVEMGKPAKV